MKKLASTIMLQGTASDVGKSILTAALCRIFYQDGNNVAPFKSQNMSLNSYVTLDGKEIGRAQGMQADACFTVATTDMNPILLKPKQDMVSQVVVHGKPYKDLDARSYRELYLHTAEGIVKESLLHLREKYDLIAIEGAGSPAEVNLKDSDIVNMRLAKWAEAPVILVADIDRGGVFASIVGTLEILTPEERDRVCGFIINKFRGDVSLLQPGIDWLEERTGKPVLGVIPFLHHIGLEDEDGASLDTKIKSTVKGEHQLDIAVIKLPRISNFTDFDPLLDELDVHLRYVSNLEEWGNPDVVIIPGSKNTMQDLLFLREFGIEDKILEYVEQGGFLLGICAGYQMLGKRLLDPNFYESDVSEIEGLGLFPMETTFVETKRTERVEGNALIFTSMLGEQEHSGENVISNDVEGYEIHMGITRFLQPVQHAFEIRLTGHKDHSFHNDGVLSENERVMGTYIHGILDNDILRRSWLNRVRWNKGWEAKEVESSYRNQREEAFERLAEHVRKYLDMKKVYQIIEEGSK
ncbi:cobyric acid synthase [Chengkuizengella axinellae]|uniref:Cobyric acid synthase n=1 Tax=Chengkuizengella axinellae TaxID=3064388 RepID=A0ABT9J0V6_9BACL|nr:cobyric acid synthase [Chengkuizengella sp. 2205SS18-9]MDP5275208.1 cobyric acid synthase [Chengkuizengella sp. 2205SS18-9]